MRDNEKAFFLFYDWIDDLDSLDGADAWKVIKAISEYHRHGTNPLDLVDGTLRVIVSIMFHQIKRKESISEQRAQAGRKGGFSRVNFAKANNSNAKQRLATEYSIQNTEYNSSLYEREKSAHVGAHTPAQEKKAYGEFGNVYLTDEEREDLTERFGERSQELIENFSLKLKSKGYAYDDHYVTIRLWAAQDSNTRADETSATYQSDAEEWFSALLDKQFDNEKENKQND